MPITPSKLISIDTPLGKDALILTDFTGSEAISKLFDFRVSMISSDLDVAIDKILGKHVTVKLETEKDKYRFFHGKVSTFSAGRILDADLDGKQIRVYDAKIVPDAWFMGLNADYRVFQDKSVPEVIEQVLKDSSVTAKVQLKGTYAKQDLCVQYGESNLQFVSRLAEQEGIFYYFSHEDKKHTLHLGDAATSYGESDQKDVDYVARDAGVGAAVTSWRRQHEFTAGKFVHWDYDFAEAKVVDAKEKTVLKIAAFKDYEVFEYPGGFMKPADGKRPAVAGIERLEARHDVGIGKSTCGAFSPGLKFKFAKHAVDGEQDQQYALTHVEHVCEAAISLSGDRQFDGYKNTFRCVPAGVAARPERTTPVPVANSVESAKVVGAKGDEIFTDKYGRVKIQFHWDRTGKYDDKSFAWVRVAQGWGAGNKWGMQFIPRVGQEVMVNFLGGDPDRPIVTGGLYNKTHELPYKVPDHKTISGIKTQSSTKGKATKNFHELRFEDKADHEHIYFHSELDFARVVENIDTLEVGYDKSKYDGGDNKLKFPGEKGDQVIQILNNRSTTLDKGKDELTVSKGDQLITIEKGNRSVKIKAGKQYTEAAKEILLKVGQSSIKIDQQGITITSAKVKVDGKMSVAIKAGMKLDAQGTMTTVKGDGMLTLKGGLTKIN